MGLGVLALGYGVYLFSAAQQSASWASTEGRIEHVEIEVSTTTRKTSSSSRPSERQKKIRYYVALAYSYEVDGHTYEASRYAFGQGARVSKKYKTHEAAQEAARSYVSGDPIAVHYDPSDPSEAVIRAGVTRAIWLPFVFGLLFAGVGTALYFDVCRKSTS